VQVAPFPWRVPSIGLHRPGVPRPAPPQSRGQSVFDPQRLKEQQAKASEARRGPVSPRIVGGSDASPLEFPWQVAYQVNQKDMCGGTLIALDWVLTAAHCIYSAMTATVVVGTKELAKVDATMQFTAADKFIPHEDWDRETFLNDIGLIHLSKPFELSAAVAPVALPPRSAPSLEGGDLLTVTGYGMDDTDGAALDLRWSLHQVALPVLAQEECVRTYGAEMVQEGSMCLVTEGGHSACDGDSGGPMSREEDGRAVVRGVTSYVAKEGCLSGIPSGAIRVREYLDWIGLNTGIAIQD